MKQLIVSAAFLLLVSCGGQSTQTATTMPTEKSDECTFSEEVCREALNFQNEYDRMSKEQQEDMVPVLNQYVEHCEMAKKECKKSMR